MQVCTRCHTSDNPDTAKFCYKCGGSPLRRYRKRMLNLSPADRAALAKSSLQVGGVTGGLTAIILLIFALLLVGLSFWLVPSQSKPLTALASGAQLCDVQDVNIGMVQSGQSIKRAITLDNCGSQPLTWQGQGDGSSWLLLEKSQGTLAPGETDQISFTATANSSSQEPLSAFVLITSNGGNQQVAVTMTVVPLSTPIPTHAAAPTPTPSPISSSTPTPTPTQPHLSGPVVRQITSHTQTQSQTVDATGEGTTRGTYAKGNLILRDTYDETHQFVVTVHAGTIFDGTGNSPNVQMMIDDTIRVRGDGTPAYAHAHVVQIGAIGNVSNWVHYGNSEDNAPQYLYVSLNAPFTGGKDPQPYTFVRQSDIDAAAKPLKAITQQSAIADIKRQLHHNEHLISNPQCNPKVTQNHKAGARATTVKVTVRTTCKAQAST